MNAAILAGVLHAAARLDAAADIHAPGADAPDGLGDVVRVQPAGEHEPRSSPPERGRAPSPAPRPVPLVAASKRARSSRASGRRVQTGHVAVHRQRARRRRAGAARRSRAPRSAASRAGRDPRSPPIPPAAGGASPRPAGSRAGPAPRDRPHPRGVTRRGDGGEHEPDGVRAGLDRRADRVRRA